MGGAWLLYQLNLPPTGIIFVGASDAGSGTDFGFPSIMHWVQVNLEEPQPVYEATLTPEVSGTKIPLG